VLARQPGEKGAWSLASIITTSTASTTSTATSVSFGGSSTGDLYNNSSNWEYAVLFADGTEAEGLSFVHVQPLELVKEE
jgi:hypothetical protein